MKKKVSELELYEVDYFVALAEKLETIISDEVCRIRVNEDWRFEDYSPTTNPSQAWPIIEREKIKSMCVNDIWMSSIIDKNFWIGKTSLESAMRAYLHSIYGEEVDM
jgi:hypothetical protein